MIIECQLHNGFLILNIFLLVFIFLNTQVLKEKETQKNDNKVTKGSVKYSF